MTSGSRQYSAPPDIPGLQFVQPLGKGGYADVFLYEQEMPRMKVAVKVLMAEGLTDAVRRQFTAEGNAMAELADHPYIVQVFRAGIAGDGRPYLLMKYYPLANMGVRARREQIPVAEVLSLGIEICSAVEAAHRIGILHRDIKPANILTGQYGAPGLTDFGIAATKATAGQTDPEGMSIPWSPPEVLFATSQADERSDVYALGATLWHLLVGRSPFEIAGGDNSSLALMRRIHDNPVPRSGRPNVPDSLERLLQQAMSKDPALRPPSALALARGLQQVEQEQGFPLTKIVVAADVLAKPMNEQDPEDATRVRTPVQITAQPIVPPRYSMSAPTHAPPVAPANRPTAGQPLSAGQASAAQDQRSPHPAWAQETGVGNGTGTGWAPRTGAPVDDRPAGTSHPASPDDAEDVESSGVRPTWILIGVAVLAVIGIGIGLLINGGGSAKPTPDKTVPGNTTDTNALLAPPPGKPAIAAKRTGPTTVVFTWKYDNPIEDDTFRVTSNLSSTSQVAKTPSITLTGKAHQRVCVTVTVYRYSGSDTSDPSDQVCAP
jgi:serine/threonine protein kinase